MASHRRGPWSQAEDAYLVQLVHTQGALNWVRVAQLIGSRSPKQCRERYHQNLKPSLNHEPISAAEGVLIEKMVGEMGKRWADIARRLHGRSDNAVKNWWNGSMNRRRRHVLREKCANASSTTAAPRYHQDEHYDAHSYARPSYAYASPVLHADYTRYHQEQSLPSPTSTEISRSDSYDGRAPSLISDSSSAYSPHEASSPRFELPPLQSYASSSRRSSLPGLQFETSPSASPYQHAMYASRYHVDKLPSPSAVYAKQPESVLSFSRSILERPCTPPMPIRLAPLQLPALPIQKPSGQDGRMKMANLLG